MKIRQLFSGLVKYETVPESRQTKETDLRHPDDKAPDLSKPTIRPGFKEKVFGLAHTLIKANESTT